MDSCHNVLSTLRDEGWFGREPHNGSIMLRHRETMEEVTTPGADLFFEIRRQLTVSVEESSTLRYFRMWVSV